MHVCTHRIILMVSHRHTKARMESYTHRYTGMHTHVQSHTYNSHIHVCMYAHIESYTWSHTDTHKGTHGVLHTHTSRGMLVTGEKSFLRASPSPSISPSLTLDPSLLPSPGHQLWFHQQEHKSWICQAGLIPRGVETAQGSEENSGVRAGQCCAETPSPAAPGSCRGHSGRLSGSIRWKAPPRRAAVMCVWGPTGTTRHWPPTEVPGGSPRSPLPLVPINTVLLCGHQDSV